MRPSTGSLESRGTGPPAEKSPNQTALSAGIPRAPWVHRNQKERPRLLAALFAETLPAPTPRGPVAAFQTARCARVWSAACVCSHSAEADGGRR